MINYQYGLWGTNWFVKRWTWFADPKDESGLALANFFSYRDIDVPDFFKKSGLTSVIDLQQSWNEIESRMRPKFIREQISKGLKRGIVVVGPDNNHLSFAVRLYRRFRRQMNLPPDRPPPPRVSKLFSAYHENQLLAIGWFLSDGVYCRAWALASERFASSRQRELVGQANRLLLVQAIKWARDTSHQVFDLGGISPESPNSRQRSLAEFKEAFRGRRVKTYYYYRVYSSLLKLWLRWCGFKNV